MEAFKERSFGHKSKFSEKEIILNNTNNLQSSGTSIATGGLAWIFLLQFRNCKIQFTLQS